MIPLRAADVAEVTGGRLHGTDPETVVSAPAAVDSRAVDAGGLFVAVPGERVDGHDYAGQAVEAGAALVLASRPVPAPCVVVEDTVEALGQVAAEVVRRLPRTRVLALTGSQGKTGTKDLLHQVLRAGGETVATEGNLNNEIGVPLTVTRATEDTAYLVVEMGARHIGNIAYLCRIAPPDVGVVLNVGVAHLGEFGSRAGIAQAKGELVEALPAGGHAVLNADDPLVASMTDRTAATVRTFGESPDADVRLTELHSTADAEPEFVLEHAGRRVAVRLRMLGEHQAYNAAAAAAAALAVGIPLDAVAAALNAATTVSSSRMERHELADGIQLINDAYNANPDSMRAALTTATTIARSRHARTVAVLGQMRELGDAANEEHRRLGALASDLGVDVLVLVGEGAATVADGWRGDPVHRAEDAEAAVRVVQSLLRPGDVVLVKASLTIGLQRVAHGLLAAARHTASGPAGPEGADERNSSR